MGFIDSWSFSRLSAYEHCPYRIKLQDVDKVEQLARDPASDPLARGDRIHNELEDYVKGEGPLPKEARKFEELLVQLQGLYMDGLVDLEQKWGFDSNWQSVSWKEAWARIKLDFCVNGGKIAVVSDYKTGKSFMKEIPHIQQTQLYAGAAALKYPKVETIITEIWYIDEGWIKPINYRRDVALDFLVRFEKRAQVMLDDTRFKPRPSIQNCKWCPYGNGVDKQGRPVGNGKCGWAI